MIRSVDRPGRIVFVAYHRDYRKRWAILNFACQARTLTLYRYCKTVKRLKSNYLIFVESKLF